MTKYLIAILVACFYSVICQAQTLRYVAKTGDDNNSGSINEPFETIARATKELRSGDTLFIREGVYNERIRLSKRNAKEEAPIVIKNYGDDNVIIDGSLSVEDLGSTGWEQYKGEIYRTQINAEITQVFVNRVWMMAARWPNARFDKGQGWDQSTWSEGRESRSSNTVECDDPGDGHDLAATGLDVTGAMAVMNTGKFVSCARMVVAHKAGQETFEFSPKFTRYLPVMHRYFLEGKLNLLDNETEWYFDPQDKYLYLWAPGGGVPKNVRAKTESCGISLDRSSNIKIQGLNFFARNFMISKGGKITIEDCIFDYPVYNKRSLGNHNLTLGCEIKNSPNNKVINCVLRNTDGLGIRVLGSNNTVVENCEFTNIDYTVAHQPMGGGTVVFRRSPNCIFRRNTVRTTGSARGIGFDGHSIMELNDFSDMCHLQRDGSTSEFGGGAKEMLFTHNWFSDNEKTSARFSDGPRGELPKSGMRTGVLRNNVTVKPHQSLTFMIKGDERYVYNNIAETNIVFSDTSNDPKKSGIHHNSVSANNATATYVSRVFPRYVKPSGTHLTNWESKGEKEKFKLLFYDWENRDYRPRPNSGLVDAGTVIEGITDRYRGEAPDIGAYELGDDNYWIPGRQLAISSRPIPMNNGETHYERVDLMWLKAYKSTASEVYFGESKEGLVSKGRFKNNMCHPGKLEKGKTYYWRVDAIVNGKIVKGDTWSFTAGVETIGEPIKLKSVTKEVRFDDETVKIYPNPSSEIINVEITEKGVMLSVFSLQGKKVLVKKMNGNKETINIGSLDNGIYILRIEKNGNFVYKKFIKM
ncbi:T9SS type A sorting domain-containing protein [Prolixibacteraceae bacterium]|nr:T9SS type A sorting domain-containing protein [Prolixibacteraceae bacterium]